MSKVIVWGLTWFNKDLKDATHRVTAIHIDNRSHIATFIIEKGVNVDELKLSMSACEELGIINLQKLENFCK
jgi:hypothetical protein